MGFSVETITDGKRLVRGEHYLLSRKYLRARDGVHHAKWRVMILAGGAPHGEVAAIRELMPKAWILAVDKSQECIEAAIDAGVDEVVQCDLGAFSKSGRAYGAGNKKTFAPDAIQKHGPFDVVNLDLCGSANDEMRSIVRVYRGLVRRGGVLLGTFSIGRDVVEALHANATRWYPHTEAILKKVPTAVALRIGYILTQGQIISDLCSVATYRGPAMPMCSYAAAVSGRIGGVSWFEFEPGDYESAVLDFDPRIIYDCPEARIREMRNRRAALKAVATRRERVQVEREERPLLIAGVEA